jgi:hypothetical protein
LPFRIVRSIHVIARRGAISRVRSRSSWRPCEGDNRRALESNLRRRAHFIPFLSIFMATAKEPKMAQTSTKPVQTFRLRGLSVSVFANAAETDDGRALTFHKVSLQRVYRDGNEFKTTSSLGRDDLPVARLLLRRAWEFILDAEAARGKEDDSE